MSRFVGVAPTLVVPDIDATAGWFERVLGFTTEHAIRDHGPGDDAIPDGPDHVHTGPATFAIIGRDGLRLMLTRASDGLARVNGAADGSMHDVYFWVTGLQAIYEAARAHSRAIDPPEDRFYGVREVTLRTPDGHLIALGELLRQPA